MNTDIEVLVEEIDKLDASITKNMRDIIHKLEETVDYMKANRKKREAMEK